MFHEGGFHTSIQTTAGFRIAFPFRGRNPLYLPLQLACGPGDSGNTDLPWPAPSSIFISGGSPQCVQLKTGCKRGMRVSIVADLNRTPHGTNWRRAMHLLSARLARPLIWLSHCMSLTVRFSGVDSIKPQASPLWCSPANPLSFNLAIVTHQAARLNSFPAGTRTAVGRSNT